MHKNYKRTWVPCKFCDSSGRPSGDQIGYWEEYEKSEGKSKPTKCWRCDGKGYKLQLEQRFLCIGGSQSGVHKTVEEAGDVYRVYNSSSQYRRYVGPSAVLIHKSVLRNPVN